jgi:hypothetical protein
MKTKQKLPENEMKRICTIRSEESPKEDPNTRYKTKTDC